MISRVNLENKEAVVLHYYNYRNSSLIVNLFIRDYGKVNAIAKGVKDSRKNVTSLLQPFQKISVSLTGKNELLTLKDVESSAQNWKLSGKSLYCAYYLNELLLRLLPQQTDCQAIFELYTRVLELLVNNSEQQNIYFEAPLRLFEKKLLDFLGYGLNLSHEIQTGSLIDIDKHYYYLIQSGPSERLPAEEHYLQISGKTLIHLNNSQFNDQKTLQESKQLLKWALAEHLGSKPLKSREMFRQLFC